MNLKGGNLGQVHPSYGEKQYSVAQTYHITETGPPPPAEGHPSYDVGQYSVSQMYSKWLMNMFSTERPLNFAFRFSRRHQNCPAANPGPPQRTGGLQ